MNERETVAVVNHEGGMVLIAKADYDPKKHKLWKDHPPKKAEGSKE